jgi:hypothetical protein
LFLRKLRIEYAGPDLNYRPCPIAWIDNFAMRNFTNDAVFDDTLPIGDGLLEAGFRVPVDLLRASMEDWFHRKGYIRSGESVRVTEVKMTELAQATGSK